MSLDDMNISAEEKQEARARRRKKQSRISVLLAMFGILIVLVLITCLAGIIYMWVNGESWKNANEQAVAIPSTEITAAEAANGAADTENTVAYTQEELDALIAEEREAAAAEAKAEVLDGIKMSLIADDVTIVEMLRPYYENDLVVASEGKYHFIPIQEELKMNDYVNENLVVLENGEYQYMEDGQVISYKGIDVSKFQGEIDWKKVAADGVEFAFIRVGSRGYGSNGTLLEDATFDQNIRGAIQAGIKVGVYFYTQAVNETEVMEEANFVLEKIAPYKIDCPVVFDVEKVSGTNGRMNALTVEERTNLTLIFCQAIENAGYTPMIYYNLEMGALMLDLEPLEEYDKWFAYYNGDLYYPYDYKIWQ